MVGIYHSEVLRELVMPKEWKDVSNNTAPPNPNVQVVSSSPREIIVEKLLARQSYFHVRFPRDGQLKRTKVKPELRQQRQEDFAQTLKVD
jgi:hypothetical protein